MDPNKLNLKIVSLQNVLLHEEIEYNRVDQLADRLGRDRLLKNPPMVAESDDNGTPRYIVLDGASRSSALRKLNVPDILVQIVDYHSPTVKLESWNHLILGITPTDLRRELDDTSCIVMVEMDEPQAQRELEERKILGYLKFSDGKLAGLRCSSDLAEQAAALNDVVRAYEYKAEIYRVPLTNLDQRVGSNKPVGAVMVFPRYKPDEIIKLALSGARVPMGITRHIIPGRALRLNLSLDILESDQPLEEKNEWLKNWVDEKIKNRSARYYQEPVFLFDE